jgi:transcriptional regulator with XRE-family HTH domain
MHMESQQQMQIIFDEVISRVKSAMNGDSVYAFAKKLGISQQTADCYINGKRKPSIDFLYRICIVCNCSADWLLGLTAAPPSPSPPDRAGQLKREIEAILKKY